MQSAPNQDRGIVRWTIKTGVWVLAGFLLITIALIFSARADKQSFPSVTNTRSSGYAALAELLRRDGYDVVLERSFRPQISPSDLIVMPFVVRETYDVDFDEVQGEDIFGSQIESSFDKAVTDHFDKGGRLVAIYNWIDFEAASVQSSQPRTLRNSASPEETLTVTLPFGSTPFNSPSWSESDYASWMLDDYGFVTVSTFQGGAKIVIEDGLPFTNRFLDKEQNAEFALSVFRAVAPQGSRIVFIESEIGNAETPSVAKTLGEWAIAARWQAIMLFVVLIYTYGRRFGQPERERRAVRGSRELYDALADVFRRTHNTGLALDHLLNECDVRIKRALHLSATTKRSELINRVTPELRNQYLNVSELAGGGANPEKATQAAHRLLEMIGQLERDARESRGLKR